MDVISWLGGLFRRPACAECQIVQRQHFNLLEERVGLKEKVETLREKNIILAERTADAQGEVEYLKEQIRLYQTRLGIIIPEKTVTTTESRPLRNAREPFEKMSARVEADRKQAYWKSRASEVEGTLGNTTETETPTVSEKNS